MMRFIIDIAAKSTKVAFAGEDGEITQDKILKRLLISQKTVLFLLRPQGVGRASAFS